ncbi:MAG: hypothetical protein LKE40_15655 [Spirochaetia bacterium]|jgi:hypothetical protein|nr:hypothetical protein [Spirochaetia bacterium]
MKKFVTLFAVTFVCLTAIFASVPTYEASAYGGYGYNRIGEKGTYTNSNLGYSSSTKTQDIQKGLLFGGKVTVGDGSSVSGYASADFGLMFSGEIKTSVLGIELSNDLDLDGLNNWMNFSVGGQYSVPLSETVRFKLSVGPNLLYEFASEKESDGMDDMWACGIQGNLGVSVETEDTLSIVAGCTLAYDPWIFGSDALDEAKEHLTDVSRSILIVYPTIGVTFNL